MLRVALPESQKIQGSGYGYGYGSIVWSLVAQSTILNWPASQRQRYEELVATPDTTLAFWKSTTDGYSANGGDRTVAAVPGAVEEIAGPLRICTRNALHATMAPNNWKGERLWVVALFGEVQVQEDKFGALKREIIGEVPC